MLLLYHRLYVCTVSVFSMMKKCSNSVAVSNIAVSILVRSEEKYWKAKPLTIQTDKSKW